MRDMIEEDIRQHGQALTIIGSGGNRETVGIKVSKDGVMWFRSEVQVQAGDWIMDPVDGAKYYVTEVDRPTEYRRPVGVRAYYRTEAQYKADLAASRPSTANFSFHGPVHGSVIGTNNTAELTNNFDFRSIEQQIEREGGEDKEELKAALEEIRQLLEQGDKLDRGALSRFSGAMERHSWFTGSVMQALLGFATQAAG